MITTDLIQRHCLPSSVTSAIRGGQDPLQRVSLGDVRGDVRSGEHQSLHQGRQAYGQRRQPGGRRRSQHAGELLSSLWAAQKGLNV